MYLFWKIQALISSQEKTKQLFSSSSTQVAALQMSYKTVKFYTVGYTRDRQCTAENILLLLSLYGFLGVKQQPRRTHAPCTWPRTMFKRRAEKTGSVSSLDKLHPILYMKGRQGI